MIDTFILTIHFDGYTRVYYAISRVAVNRFVSYHQSNPDYYGYDIASI